MVSVFKAGLLGDNFQVDVPEVEEISDFLKNMNNT
jgi:CO dehydrogenase maturation factor